MQSTPIEKSALGTQIQLGTLYDAVNGTFFTGYSLWKLADIEESQRILPTTSIKLKISSSLEETRENFGIDAESRLGLNFQMCKLSGFAKFLEEKANESREARVDITCVKVNQTRSIPMETMVNLKFDKVVFQNCADVTHFVAEVTEGAFGNISLIKTCSDSEEARKVAGSISGSLKQFCFSVEGGENSLELGTHKNFRKENFEINAEGAIDEPIGTFEEAARIGKDLPKTLKAVSNTLTVKLLPISILDSAVRIIVRNLDENVIEEINSTLKAAKVTVESLSELENLANMAYFANLKRQGQNFRNQFNDCFAEFQQSIRKLLPQLKLGSVEDDILMLELDKTVGLMKKRCLIGSEYVAKKHRESESILATFESLESIGFKNSFKNTGDIGKSLINKSSGIKLLLNFSGEGIGDIHHPMENFLKTTSTTEDESQGGNKSSDSDEENLEWFEDDVKIMLLR